MRRTQQSSAIEHYDKHTNCLSLLLVGFVYYDASSNTSNGHTDTNTDAENRMIVITMVIIIILITILLLLLLLLLLLIIIIMIILIIWQSSRERSAATIRGVRPFVYVSILALV